MTDNFGSLRYYILFSNYEQGLIAHRILDDANIENRIAPAPRSLQKELSCGMSLMLKPQHVKIAERCLEKCKAQYHAILPLENQLYAHRDKYC